MLHAFPVDSRMWQPLASLAPDAAITIDMRGFGDSACAEAGPWTVGQFADDVMQTMESLGLGQAVFCGCSMGGYVIFELWRRHRQAVRGMILCDTRPDPDTEETRRRRTSQIERVNIEGTDFLCQFAATQLVSRSTQQNNPALIAEILDWVRSVPPATVIGTLQALASRPDSRRDLPGIDVPVLVVAGSEDTITPPAMCQAMACAIRKAVMAEIPEAGHLAALEHPTAVLDAITQFLARLPEA